MKTTMFNRKARHFCVIATIILLLPTIRSMAGVTYAVNTASLTISPPQVVVSHAVPFVVKVSVTNVVDLYFWQIRLVFDPAKLTCLSVSEPADSIFYGQDVQGLVKEINNTAGYVKARNGLWSAVGGFTGTGTLCEIEFKPLQPTITTISFVKIGEYDGTVLYDSSQPPRSILFDTVNGFVQTNALGFQLTSYQAMKAGVPYTVMIFTNTSITWFIYDEPNEKILMTTSGPDLTTAFLTIQIPLALMASSYFTTSINEAVKHSTVFQDITSHIVTIAYGQSASTFRVYPTVGGDLNGDREVDMRDVALPAYSFGCTPGTSRWNPIADVDSDLDIDMKDIAFVSKNFGLRYQMG